MSAPPERAADVAAALPLRDLLCRAREVFEPRVHPDESFDCYSNARFASGEPEILRSDSLRGRVQLVQPDDVLLSRLVGQVRRAWVVGANRGRRQLATTDWLVLRSPRHDPNYLRHLLVSHGFHLRFMRAAARHGKSARASPRQVADIDVPVPALEEQRRIARLLDEANQLRVRRRRSFDLLTQLPAALFHDVFGDAAALGTLPEAAFGALCSEAPAVGRECEASARGAATLLGASSVHGDRLDLRFAARVDAGPGAPNQLEDGDLLLAQGDASGGACAVVHPGAAFWLFDASLVRVRLDPQRVHPQYVAGYLRSAHGRVLIGRCLRGKGARARIDSGKLAAQPLPLPPIAQQREYARRLAALVPLDAAVNRSALALDQLLGNLRDRAYAGTLNPA